MEYSVSDDSESSEMDKSYQVGFLELTLTYKYFIFLAKANTIVLKHALIKYIFIDVSLIFFEHFQKK